MIYWISVPVGWKLQDVQAAISIATAFLCAGGVFILVRFFWVNAARDVVKHKRAIPAHTLLSLNTIGEVIDIIWLLRGDLFTRKYTQIAIQSICILLLTAASLLSALLARYSTRARILPVPRETFGILAERELGGYLQTNEAGIIANRTLGTLSRANFPLNQVLDFLPDPEVEWEYQPDQWSNSWSMNCTYTELTEIPNANVQDCSESILNQVPYVNHLFADWPETAWDWKPAWSGSGFERDQYQWNDYTMFVVGIWGVDLYSNDTFTPEECYSCPMKEVNVKSYWIHMSDVGRSNASTDGTISSCVFRRSHAALFQYTGMNCKLVKNITSTPNKDAPPAAEAAPDMFVSFAATEAYNSQYGTRMIRESMQGLPITVVYGEDLAQFYQAALIVQDTQMSRQRRVPRVINVYTPVTQVSVIYLIICCVGAFIDLLGLIYYYFFIFKHWDSHSEVPQSKLDWVVQNMRLENEQKEKDMRYAYSTTASSEVGMGSSASSRYTSSMMRTPENSSLIGSSHAGVKGWR